MYFVVDPSIVTPDNFGLCTCTEENLQLHIVVSDTHLL